MFRRLIVLDQDLAQGCFAAAGEFLLAWVAAHRDRLRLGIDPAKGVASGPAGELFVQAIAKSWHEAEPFG